MSWLADGSAQGVKEIGSEGCPLPIEFMGTICRLVSLPFTLLKLAIPLVVVEEPTVTHEPKKLAWIK
jgi:hypothetical protein